MKNNRYNRIIARLHGKINRYVKNETRPSFYVACGPDQDRISQLSITVFN